MKWVHICQDADSVTEAMQVGLGVLVRVWSLENDDISVVLVPNVRIMEGGCGERNMIIPRTETRR